MENDVTAFPVIKSSLMRQHRREADRFTEDYETEGGMKLRDYFAAKIIQGICASGPAPEWTNDRLAREAYSMADAMMKARNNDN